jgi:hypothetical protein
MVEGFVNAESMAAMIQRGKMEPNDAAPPANAKEVDWTIERDGLSRFTATPDARDEKAPTLVFERDGLGWRLTEIKVPGLGLGGPRAQP